MVLRTRDYSLDAKKSEQGNSWETRQPHVTGPLDARTGERRALDARRSEQRASHHSSGYIDLHEDLWYFVFNLVLNFTDWNQTQVTQLHSIVRSSLQRI